MWKAWLRLSPEGKTLDSSVSLLLDLLWKLSDSEDFSEEPRPKIGDPNFRKIESGKDLQLHIFDAELFEKKNVSKESLTLLET